MPTRLTDEETLRTAEVVATVCVATDLGMGFPLEHGCQATLMAIRFCDILGLHEDVVSQVYYGSMLMYSGCTSEASLGPQIMSGNRIETFIPHLFGGNYERLASIIRSLPPSNSSSLARVLETARRFPGLIARTREQQTAICEVAEMMSRRLGLPAEIHGIFTFLTERWDGNNLLRRAEGDEIPLAVRIVVMTRDLAFQRHIGGEARARGIAEQRAGHAFDPDLARTFVAHSAEIFAETDRDDSTWRAVLEAEPKPRRLLRNEEIDRALAAMGGFSDLLAPSFSGHSAGLSELVGPAAVIAGMGPAEERDLRRAALVHDIGRVAVDPAVWEKRGRLTRDEQEQVRLHPYHTERVLSPSSFFQPLSLLARDHHERLDGSGYHRAVDASSLSSPARLLAAADTFRAMTEPRAHRPARDPEDAARQLAGLADDGLLDHAMVSAVIEASGVPVPAMERPAGMTEREAQVIGLLARGLQTKQIATALGISPKTADTHIQSSYRKMGVSTRAAAALCAMEYGMVPSGELPIHD